MVKVVLLHSSALSNVSTKRCPDLNEQQCNMFTQQRRLSHRAVKALNINVDWKSLECKLYKVMFTKLFLSCCLDFMSKTSDGSLGLSSLGHNLLCSGPKSERPLKMEPIKRKQHNIPNKEISNPQKYTMYSRFIQGLNFTLSQKKTH